MPLLYHLDHDFRFAPEQPLFGELRLIQIGRCYCSRDSIVPAHRHAGWFELTIVTEGAGSVVTNEVPVRVRRGDIYFSFPTDLHEIIPDPDDPIKYDFYSFTCVSPEWQAELDRITSDYAPADRRVFRSEQIQFLVRNAIAEFASTDAIARDELLTALFKQILVYLVREFRPTAAAEPFHEANEAEALCYRVMNYIDSHIYTLANLSELSDFTGYSYGYLSLLFKKTTNRTLSEYYHVHRLEAARLLIDENRLKLVDIAAALGYSSLYAFSKAFRNHYGISPRTYKNR